MMRKLIPVLALFTPGLAFAAGSTPTTFCELVKFAVNILNALTVLMVLAALVAYLYGIAINLKDVGEDNRTKLRNIILWGIVGLFVMVSIWGILHLLQDTLFPTQTAGGVASC